MCVCLSVYVCPYMDRGEEEGGGSVSCRNRWVVVYTELEDVASHGGR